MDQQYPDPVPVCQRFQDTDVPVVIGVGVCLIPSGSDALEAVLQTEIEHFTWTSGEVPEGFPLSYLEAQPQRQPGLADLRCSRQQMQTRRQQILHKKGNRFVVNRLR